MSISPSAHLKGHTVVAVTCEIARSAGCVPQHTATSLRCKIDKFDFYAMDCYRLIDDDSLVEMRAREIVKESTAFEMEGYSHGN